MLWVVRDIGAKAIYNTSKMAIRTPNDLRRCHAWFEGRKDFTKGLVKHLSPEISKFLASGVFLVRCFKKNKLYVDQSKGVILLGIARKAITTSAFP